MLTSTLPGFAPTWLGVGYASPTISPFSENGDKSEFTVSPEP